MSDHVVSETLTCPACEERWHQILEMENERRRPTPPKLPPPVSARPENGTHGHP